VIGIDLGDERQAIAVIDHDVRVLARKTVRVKAFRLGEALDWAVAQARAKGFARVTVACEPAGPRWMQVQRLCAERGLPLACVQPLVSHIARQQQDHTTHKTDEADCVMIARLAVELHCYIPEELDEARAQLRHPGRRRAQLVTSATASVQRVRDFLSVAWPAAPEACKEPFDSVTWLAAVQAVLSRCGAQPEKLAAMGQEAFTVLVRRPLPGWGGSRADGRVRRAVFAALAGAEGAVAWSRRGLLRRCADELGDLQRTRARLRAVEAGMVTALGEPGLSRLADIPGLTATGAAAVLAETGGPRRYDSSSSLVKHAGLSPAGNASGAFEGEAHISRRGRPGLRLAVWRVIWPVLIHNRVMAARYRAMTSAADAAAAGHAQAGTGSRQASAAARAARTRRAKARVACGASLLRWIYSMVVHGTSWDPATASGPAGCPAEAA
jgi:transposase